MKKKRSDTGRNKEQQRGNKKRKRARKGEEGEGIKRPMQRSEA